MATWVDQLENSNNNPSANTFFLLIDDIHYLLIDVSHKLIISDTSSPGPSIWTDQNEL